MSRPCKFNSARELKKAWEEYKIYCDSQMVLTHEFSSKSSEFVSKKLQRSMTYTIEGFCVFVGISRAAFYEKYAQNNKFLDTVTRMKEECEVDARKKFELGEIDSRLAGLWMSNYGYSTKADENVELKNNVKIVDDMDG